MIEWIQNNLIPYVIDIRSQINQDNHPVVLMMDNLSQHFSEKVINELKKIEPYILIPLPAHSSHITQVCDACIFSLSKAKYNSIPYPASYSKFTAKLLRVKKAIESTFSQETIISSWSHCGFNIEIEDGICKSIKFSEEFQTKLRDLGKK